MMTLMMMMMMARDHYYCGGERRADDGVDYPTMREGVGPGGSWFLGIGRGGGGAGGGDMLFCVTIRSS